MTTNQRERVKSTVVKSLALGASVLAACAGVQISRSTFYRWLEGDATFEEAVMMARIGLIEEVMGELRLLAFGRYVEEERIVETASGLRKEWRKRWRDGKVSALMAMVKMMEKDSERMERGNFTTKGTKAAKAAKEGRGMVEDGEGGRGVSGGGEAGRVGSPLGSASHIEEQGDAVSVGVSRLSRFEEETGDEARWDGLAGRVGSPPGSASHTEERRSAVSVEVSRVSRNALKNGGAAVVRETRRERRARERQEFKAAKRAAKRQV